MLGFQKCNVILVVTGIQGGGWTQLNPTYVYVSQNVFLLGHLNLLKHWRVPSLSVRFTCEGCLQKLTTIFLPILVHQMPNRVRSINKIHQTKNISQNEPPLKNPSQKCMTTKSQSKHFFLANSRSASTLKGGHPSDKSQSLVVSPIRIGLWDPFLT